MAFGGGGGGLPFFLCGVSFLHNGWRAIAPPQRFITVNHGACPGEGKGKGKKQAGLTTDTRGTHSTRRRAQ